MKNILEVRNLHKRYGQVTALNDISFDVREGEIISILGPSGCGKSTLLQLIAGLQEPDDGQILLDNQVIARSKLTLPSEKRPVNMVFQDYALWPHMNVEENIAYGLKRQKIRSSVRKERVAEMLKLLQLEEYAYRLPSQLSGGQQQRVGIARALATQNRLLLMDEPLSNLDVKLRMQMRSELAVLLRKLNITALHVTHDTFEAFALADRLLILKDGEIEQLDTPEQVYQNPASPWVANLLGFHVQLKGKWEKTRKLMSDEVRLLLQDQRIRGNLKGINAEFYSKELHQDVTIMIHPEDIELVENGSKEFNKQEINFLEGKVVFSSFEGRSWRNSVQIDQEQYVSVATDQPLEIGMKVQVKFPVAKTFIFCKMGAELIGVS